MNTFPTVTKWHLTALQTTGVISLALASMGNFDGRVVMQNNQVAGAWQLTETNPVLVSKIETGNGGKKLFFSLFGLGCGVAAYALREIKERQLEEKLLQQANLKEAREILEKVEKEKLLMEAEEELKAYQAVAEGKALGKTAQLLGVDPGVLFGETETQPVVNVPAQTVNQVLPMHQSQEQALVPSNPLPPQPTQVKQVELPKTEPIQPAINTALPDGARLIQATELGNINRYPVMLFVVGMGGGKTMTARYIMSCNEGHKVFASPDAKAKHYKQFDLVFGAYGNYGAESESSFLDDTAKDLTYWMKQPNKEKLSMADYVWGVFREIKNRQQLEEEEIAKLPIYRCFFDEASSTYTTAKNRKFYLQDKIEESNCETFFNARKHRTQITFAAQSDSVDIIGLKGLSQARDDMWYVYPGETAIAEAKRLDKKGLANWLQNRLNQGYAIALLIKQNTIFEVLNMPTVEELKKL